MPNQPTVHSHQYWVYKFTQFHLWVYLQFSQCVCQTSPRCIHTNIGCINSHNFTYWVYLQFSQCVPNQPTVHSHLYWVYKFTQFHLLGVLTVLTMCAKPAHSAFTPILGVQIHTISSMLARYTLTRIQLCRSNKRIKGKI